MTSNNKNNNEIGFWAWWIAGAVFMVIGIFQGAVPPSIFGAMLCYTGLKLFT